LKAKLAKRFAFLIIEVTSFAHKKLTMISKNEAKVMAERFLNTQPTEDYTLILNEEATLEESFGWFFFYNSKEYLVDANSSFALAGNSPIIVDKDSGKLYRTGKRA
jgi:hypothetical protein